MDYSSESPVCEAFGFLDLYNVQTSDFVDNRLVQPKLFTNSLGDGDAFSQIRL
jgi:hypothetical protein